MDDLGIIPVSQTPSTQRPPNSSDNAMLFEAAVPNTLRLVDVVVPDVSKLARMTEISARYKWDKVEFLYHANYDQIATDMVCLQSLMIENTDLDGFLEMAKSNIESNRDTIHAYHFHRLRQQADELFAQQQFDYQEKRAGKPERTSDSVLKAKCDVYIAMLGYPAQINYVKAVAKQVEKLMDRCEGLIQIFKRLLNRSGQYGQ
jgi:hypothetical protein